MSDRGDESSSFDLKDFISCMCSYIEDLLVIFGVCGLIFEVVL